MAAKTGMAIVTVLLKHICSVLTAYRTKMDATINAAVVGGVITSTQRDILNTFLNGAQTACDIMRLITLY